MLTEEVVLGAPVGACSADLMRAIRGRPDTTTDLSGHARRVVKVGLAGAALPLAKRVVIEFGVPVRIGDRLRVPVTWCAEPGGALFPELDAVLQLDAESPQTSRLTLHAKYVPPLGTLGERVDRALLHRLAHRTVQHFMEQVVIDTREQGARRVAAAASRDAGD